MKLPSRPVLMKCLFTVVLSSLVFWSAVGQDCRKLVQDKLIQKVTDPSIAGVVNYWGIGKVDFTQTDGMGIVELMVGKSIAGADTTYRIRILQGSSSTPDEMQGVSLLLADGTTIRKPNQPVRAEGSGNAYSLSVEAELTKAEFLALGRKPLSEVTLMRSTAEVPKGLSASILSLVPCVMNFW